MLDNWQVRNKTLLFLFLINIVAYMDRANFNVAAPYLAKTLHLNHGQIGMIMSAFMLGYGGLQVIGGILVDRFGIRKTLVLAISWWSAFTVATGFATGFVSLVVIRFIFGSGESFLPPAVYKAVSLWFPKKERLRGNSIMLAATALAPAITPLIVVWFLQGFGWKGMFYALGVPGAIMAWIGWKHMYDNPADHPKISKQELTEIYDGRPPAAQMPKMSLRDACRVRGLLLFSTIYFIYDVTYWGFFSWLPSYLVNVRKFAMLKMGIYASLPFLAGFIGLMLANAIGTKIFRRNKVAFLRLIWVIGSASMYFAYAASSPGVCIASLSVTAGCGIYMSLGPFWALVSETMPVEAMGFLSSIVNGAGKVGGSMAPAAIGFLINWSGGSYGAGFVLMEACLLVCAVLVWFIREAPQQARLSTATAAGASK